MAETKENRAERSPPLVHTARLALPGAQGLHGREAALLVKLTRFFDADLILECQGRSARATNIMGLLSLEAGPCEELTATAEGPEAEKMIRALAELFACKFQPTEEASSWLFRAVSPLLANGRDSPPHPKPSQTTLNLASMPLPTLQRAIWEDQLPEDIARTVQESLLVFQAEPTLYDAPGLQGPAKQAELIVKLGYWLAVGHLTADEFRKSADRIPPEDNCGWDVDLCPRRPGSVLPHILKMERLGPAPEICPAQQA